MAEDYIVPFDQIGMRDVARVGGKNASLGELLGHLGRAGVRVPAGFATTAEAYRLFLSRDDLGPRINERLRALQVDDVNELAAAGDAVRGWLRDAPLHDELQRAVTDAYGQLVDGGGEVAVRSSATAEDLPEASFAGQQDTFLNVRGVDAVLTAVKQVFVSLFNDRAIAYRVHHGFEHGQVLLSAGIQRMVRSDLAASGVMFTIDTETGFPDAVFINAAWGLGEAIVQGAVDPDEYYVYKPGLAAQRPAILRRHLGAKATKSIYARGGDICTVPVGDADRARFALADGEIEHLARMAVAIEHHYGRPMDIEWAKDGIDGELYILQARPETVKSRGNARELERFELRGQGPVLAQGRAIGQRVGVGPARVVAGSGELGRVHDGDVIVTDMTDPDWEPVMKRAAAIVTNRGGRTCHAAIIARELGVPAIVGCGDATATIAQGEQVTVSCAEGDTGRVYAGKLPFEVRSVALDAMPKLPFKIMMNVASPDRAFDFRSLPNEGVGLARIEFIISNTIGVHPKALLRYADMPETLRARIDERQAGYADPVSFYVDKLVEGVATLTAAFAPKPVIVRLSDFKSNEYAHLIGGDVFEPTEDNPMLGFRGAARYIDPSFRDCFELECRALRRVHRDMGLSNLWIMVPFVRTVDEARRVVELLAENGLRRGENGLKIVMMCEIPSNALLAEAFLEHFDGFSIGSNDLTQLTLGLDRDSATIAHLFDERDAAVKLLLQQAIAACRAGGKYVGICGQGPSDHPDLARWLMEQGIESVSLNPDTVVETWLFLAGKGS